ncbi:MAG: SGNH/GDSL hydrolase family protein [Armatimonadetes bacterium]|nr:SGNH/GDSL hydrolase family protein [Armatimonadota bacterium]
MLHSATLAIGACGLAFQLVGAETLPPPAPQPTNLLLNPGFGFHSFESPRSGTPSAYQSGAVACWDQEAHRDAEVFRAPRAKAFRPRFPVDNVVVLHPGKRLSQFVLLSEAGLDFGDRVSLSVLGRQSAPRSLRAAVHMVQVDGAPGEWRPADFGQQDQRTFAKVARGELTPALGASALSADAEDFELIVENVEVAGALVQTPGSGDGPPEVLGPGTIGVAVEFTNVSESDVWIYSPCLSRSPKALNRLPEGRPLPALYRHLPRTVQKLWRGEALHILLTGYSSDCGDANPPMYLYDEDPESPTFKQPLQQTFDGSKVGHPEWDNYFARWNHYFNPWGRMRCALLRKFDLPINKILVNTEACSGSYLIEAQSAFPEYASLSLPPGPANGHREGKTWQELYPDLFTRPEGPGPDLVVLCFGAKYHPDVADEVEQYEGAIRWFRRHYPNVEFIFSNNNWREGIAPNAGGLQELSLRYGIPFVDFSRALHLSTRHYNGRSPMNGDAHPQAFAHYLWYKQIERLFEAVDPIQPGIAQACPPDRISIRSLGWEGDFRTYTEPDPRFRKGTGFLLDDTVVCVWAAGNEPKLAVSVDGTLSSHPRRAPKPKRNPRSCTFAIGHLSLGDRHVVEVSGEDARFVAVDARAAPGRQWIGVESPRWRLGDLRAQPFESEWGAPYGSRQVRVPPGETVTVDAVGTFLSIAYADMADGGTLGVEVDGRECLRQATNVPFRTAAGEDLWMENRKGIGPFPYGLHRVRVTAGEGPLALLGVFAYDTRASRAQERVVRGTAYPGETVTFSPPFKARPLVLCTGGLHALPDGTSAGQVTFAGDGPGAFEAIGE